MEQKEKQSFEQHFSSRFSESFKIIANRTYTETGKELGTDLMLRDIYQASHKSDFKLQFDDEKINRENNIKKAAEEMIVTTFKNRVVHHLTKIDKDTPDYIGISLLSDNTVKVTLK